MVGLGVAGGASPGLHILPTNSLSPFSRLGHPVPSSRQPYAVLLVLLRRPEPALAARQAVLQGSSRIAMQMCPGGTLWLGIPCPPSTPHPSNPPVPASQTLMQSSLLLPVPHAPAQQPGACCSLPVTIKPLSLSLGARSGLMGLRIASSKNVVQKLQSIKTAP